MSRRRSTHTFSTLAVSRLAYDEVAALLRDAGYHHAFVDGAIDMTGIALVVADEPPASGRYVQRQDGEEFEIPSGETYRLGCCDCALVHDVVITAQDGRPVKFQASRNNRATAQRRRHRRGNR